MDNYYNTINDNCKAIIYQMERLMKAKKIISVMLTFFLFINLSVSTYAAQWQDFTDISGHWAEETLHKGFTDGLITGLEDNTLAPSASITTAQMITVLCRVLGATETTDISKLGISSDVWYANAAGKALRLGLIPAEAGNLDVPMTRQDALSMMARAFCLVPAEPNFAVLSPFSDSDKISAKNKGAIASLVSEKLVNGFDGALNANGSITRAEFLTVLYRVAENYIASDALTSGIQGGSVIKGSGTLSYISTGKIWFDCSAEDVTLSGVKADAITLRNHKLTSLSIKNSSDIARLVVAVGTGSADFDSCTDSKIGQLRLESCTNSNIGACVGNVEIAGNGISVNISGGHDYLIITGNNNTVTLSPCVSLSRLKITGENNLIKSTDKTSTEGNFVSCGEIEVLGKGNKLTFNNAVEAPCKITIGGAENAIVSSSKNVGSLVVSGTRSNTNISSLTGISDFSVTGNDNDIVVSGALTFSVNVSGSLNEIVAKSAKDIDSTVVSGNSNWLSQFCTNLPSVSISGNYNTLNKQTSGKVGAVAIPGTNNAFVLYEKNELATSEIKGASNRLTVNGTAGTITLSGRKSALDGSGKVKNLNVNASGCKISLAAEKVTDTSNQAEEARVLNLVTSGYKGNYTLKWATEHDYETSEKEIWVNAKDYSSASEYLIWVNLSMQRVNVFKGSKGAWELCHSCIVGTGAPGRGTPAGEYKTTYKTWAGWTTDTYTVKPVVGFKENTGYAFHSRLFRPGTTKLSDSSIGYPVSHGCVRMYDDDILYIYNNIPLGTTVVVY